MNLLAKDLYAAASKARKQQKMVIVKKGDAVTKLLHAIGEDVNIEDLRKELKSAEKIYKKLKGKLTKKKLGEISARIKALEEKLSVHEEMESSADYIEHEGRIISAPVLGELEEDLEAFDREFNFKEEEEEAAPPDYEAKPISKGTYPYDMEPFHVLYIPPPPEKN